MPFEDIWGGQEKQKRFFSLSHNIHIYKLTEDVFTQPLHFGQHVTQGHFKMNKAGLNPEFSFF